MESDFNPLAKIFEKPEEGAPLNEDFENMQNGTMHNADLFDEEEDGHGGEKIDPATGKPNKSLEVDEFHGLNEIDLKDSKDLMGDIKDPAKMSLEELLNTQNES